jgi:hypothetical protein
MIFVDRAASREMAYIWFVSALRGDVEDFANVAGCLASRPAPWQSQYDAARTVGRRHGRRPAARMRINM